MNRKARNLSWMMVAIAAAVLTSACGGGEAGGWSTPAPASGTPPAPPPPGPPPPVPPPPGTSPESIPDFSLDSAHTPIIQSAQSGLWSDPATWGGSVPTFSNVAKIGQGHTVTINNTGATAYTVSVNGKLAFSPSVNTSLKVTNLQVMAGLRGPGSGHRRRTRSTPI